jgi:enoyl-CoA hydratase/carnithine racemase
MNMTSEPAVLYDRIGGVARITLNHPPVNALCLAVRRGMLAAFERADLDAEVRAVVIEGSGRGFSAGGDIREFGTPAVTAAPRLTLDVQPAIEAMRKPVVAAIRGIALGGGLETAMCCHYRVAAADAIIALPEVSLGIIPLSGTQRLPRLLPLQAAIDVILSGAKHRASDFTGTPLFDRMVAGGADRAALYLAAHALALEAAERGAPYPLVSRRPVVGPSTAAVLEAARTHLDTSGSTAAQRQALLAIAAAVESADFESGLRKANAICEALLASEEVRASAARFLSKPAG